MVFRHKFEKEKYIKLSRGNVNRITTVTDYSTVREPN